MNCPVPLATLRISRSWMPQMVRWSILQKTLRGCTNWESSTCHTLRFVSYHQQLTNCLCFGVFFLKVVIEFKYCQTFPRVWSPCVLVSSKSPWKLPNLSDLRLLEDLLLRGSMHVNDLPIPGNLKTLNNKPVRSSSTIPWFIGTRAVAAPDNYWMQRLDSNSRARKYEVLRGDYCRWLPIVESNLRSIKVWKNVTSDDGRLFKGIRDPVTPYLKGSRSNNSENKWDMLMSFQLQYPPRLPWSCWTDICLRFSSLGCLLCPRSLICDTCDLNLFSHICGYQFNCVVTLISWYLHSISLEAKVRVGYLLINKSFILIKTKAYKQNVWNILH